MARYRIHRIKEAQAENFRWAPHTAGPAVVKPKDYFLDGELEAPTPYALWKTLATEGRPLRPGDLLETHHLDDTPGQLQIAKYIGFEPASWYAPAAPSTSPSSSGTDVADPSAPTNAPLHI